MNQGPSWSWSYCSWIYNYICNECLSPLKLWVRTPLDTKLCDKVCQWLATARWFSPGTPFSSTNKTDHHDITEILLKVALNIINQPTIMHLLYLWSNVTIWQLNIIDNIRNLQKTIIKYLRVKWYISIRAIRV